MKAQIQKWGNSLAVRLPSALARQAKLGLGTAIDVRVEGESIVITPVRRPRYALDALVAGITPENVHGETDWGAPQGHEEW